MDIVARLALAAAWLLVWAAGAAFLTALCTSAGPYAFRMISRWKAALPAWLLGWGLIGAGYAYVASKGLPASSLPVLYMIAVLAGAGWLAYRSVVQRRRKADPA